MPPGLDALYITYWSLRDPLTQSQALPILRGLAGRGYRMALVTYEQEPHAVPRGERRACAAALLDEGIRWFPLRYHRRPPGLAKLVDGLSGLGMTLAVRALFRPRLVHSRGSIPAVPAVMAAALSGARFFFDADSPISEEYLDIGRWSRGSLGYRVTRWAEDLALSRADAVAVLTEARRTELAARTDLPVTVLPCSVDTDRFTFDPAARERLRRELRLDGTVAVYSGKWGGWYATEEMMDFVAAARPHLPGLRLLVLTQQAPDPFQEAAARRGISQILTVRRADHAEMPGYLSAADVGLSFVRPLPSKRASSPVKNGEYLACGLPVVTTAGIGDYSTVIARERAGVVLEGFSVAQCAAAAEALGRLLVEPGLRGRCRAVALAHASLDLVTSRYLRVYDALLGPAPGRG